MDEMLAPDFVNHNKLLPGEVPGREGYKHPVLWVGRWRSKVPRSIHPSAWK